MNQKEVSPEERDKATRHHMLREKYRVQQELVVFEVETIYDLELLTPVNRVTEIKSPFTAEDLMRVASTVNTNLSVINYEGDRQFALQYTDSRESPLGTFIKLSSASDSDIRNLFTLAKSINEIDFLALTSIPYNNVYIVTSEHIWKKPSSIDLEKFVRESNLKTNLDILIEIGYLDTETLLEWIENDIERLENEIKKYKEDTNGFANLIYKIESHQNEYIPMFLNYDELIMVQAYYEEIDTKTYSDLKKFTVLNLDQLSKLELSKFELDSKVQQLQDFTQTLIKKLGTSDLILKLNHLHLTHAVKLQEFQQSLEKTLEKTANFREYKTLHPGVIDYFIEESELYLKTQFSNTTPNVHIKYLLEQVRKTRLRNILQDKNQSFLKSLSMERLDEIIHL
jgi:hypothetical protein